MATVLTLEDDRLSQRLIEKVFKNAGHEVLLAETVQSGLEALRSRVLIDMVVLDSHLGTDLGWTFLEEIRKRPLFQKMPVIVYTGFTERHEVLRYASLKVQAVHVKPIKAEVLLGELERATRQGQRSQLFHEPEKVCARLKIDRSEYATLLLAAVTHLEEDRETVNRLLSNPGDPALWPALERLKSRPRELGVRWMDELVTLIAEQIRKADRTGAAETMMAMDAIIMLVRQRAVAMLGPNAAVAQSSRPFENLAPILRSPVAVAPPSDLFGAMVRQMLGRPFWMFGDHFGGLRELNRSTEEWVQALLPATEPGQPVGRWLEAIDLIESMARVDLPDAAKMLGDVEGFGAACRRIVLRLTMVNDDAPGDELDMLTAATRLGVLPAVVLAAVARVVRPLVESPLELQPFRHHAAASALLAFEIGRLLKQEQAHRMAAAALAHHLAVWALAVTQPGLTAVALAAAGQGRPLAEAVAAVFGSTPQELAPLLLAQKQKAELLQDVARVAGTADAAQSKDGQVAATVVAIAGRLVRAAASEDAKELKAVRAQLLQPDCPEWGYLRDRGVEVPLDTAEIVEVAVTVAASASWTAREAAT